MPGATDPHGCGEPRSGRCRDQPPAARHRGGARRGGRRARRGRASPPGWPVARSLAASGWRDMTRLARGDVAMGAGIAATNAPAIATHLRQFRDVLDGWLADLERSGGTGRVGPRPAPGCRARAARRARVIEERVFVVLAHRSPTAPRGTASGPTISTCSSRRSSGTAATSRGRRWRWTPRSSR